MTDLATVFTHGTTLRFHVPPDDHLGRVLLSGRLYEADLLAWTADALPPGGLIVDVGAGIGTHAVFWAAVCQAQVVAFEPDGQTWRLLMQNVRLNHVEHRVQCVPLALGDTCAQVGLVRQPGNCGMTRLDPDGCGTVTIPLDSWPLAARCTLLKVDVEGMECEVLGGAQRLLRRDRPHLLVECHDAQRLRQLDSCLGALGYTRRACFGWTPTHHYAPGVSRETGEAPPCTR